MVQDKGVMKKLLGILGFILLLESNVFANNDFEFTEFPPEQIFGVKLYDKIYKHLTKDSKYLTKFRGTANKKKHYHYYYEPSTNKPNQLKINENNFFINYIIVVNNKNYEIIVLQAHRKLPIVLDIKQFKDTCNNEMDNFINKHKLESHKFTHQYLYSEDGYFQYVRNIDYTINKKYMNSNILKKVRFELGCMNFKASNPEFFIMLSDIDILNDTYKRDKMKTQTLDK